MKFSYALYLILLFASCMGPVDKKTLKTISSELTADEITGKWTADSFTYKMMNIEKTDRVLFLSLVLNKDNTFKAANFPIENLGDLTAGQKNLIFSGSGKWRLEKISDEWTLDLDFPPNPSFQKTFSQEYSIYLMNSRPVLLRFTGDPDQGNRILLKKE